MNLNLSRRFLPNVLFLLLAVGYLSGCSYYLTTNRTYAKQKEHLPQLAEFKYLYVEQVTRDHGLPGAEDLGQAFKKFGYYKLLTKPPQSKRQTKNTLYLQAKVSYSKFWEVELNPLSQPNQDPHENEAILLLPEERMQSPALYPSIMSNAVVVINFKLLRAEDRLLVFENESKLSFQQIYQGKKATATRPDANIEFDRLIKLGFDRFGYLLDFDRRQDYIYFESGKPHQIWRRFLPFFEGDSRIVKGIRFADGHNWKNALSTWLITTYEPLTTDEELFLKNRASAFYNMGQVYAYHKLWSKAALMFAYANQSNPSTHYAQAWSDALIAWQATLPDKLIDTEIIEFNAEWLDSRKIQKLKLFKTGPTLKRDILWPGVEFPKID